MKQLLTNGVPVLDHMHMHMHFQDWVQITNATSSRPVPNTAGCCDSSPFRPSVGLEMHWRPLYPRLPSIRVPSRFLADTLRDAADVIIESHS